MAARRARTEAGPVLLLLPGPENGVAGGDRSGLARVDARHARLRVRARDGFVRIRGERLSGPRRGAGAAGAAAAARVSFRDPRDGAHAVRARGACAGRAVDAPARATVGALRPHDRAQRLARGDVRSGIRRSRACARNARSLHHGARGSVRDRCGRCDCAALAPAAGGGRSGRTLVVPVQLLGCAQRAGILAVSRSACIDRLQLGRRSRSRANTCPSNLCPRSQRYLCRPCRSRSRVAGRPRDRSVYRRCVCPGSRLAAGVASSVAAALEPRPASAVRPHAARGGARSLPAVHSGATRLGRLRREPTWVWPHPERPR